MIISIINLRQIVGISSDNSLKKGKDLANLDQLENAYLKIKEDKILAFGPMSDFIQEGEVVDANGGTLFPSWVDSHTHLVFAGSRESEFVDRINGLSYEDIAARGGGILNSAEKLEHMPFEELLEDAYKRLLKLIKMGTGAIEIKSGYGLSFKAELKILRVIKALKSMSPIPIKATFLGAHALPKAYKNDRNAYIAMLVEDLLPVIKEEQLAEYIDVFCETNYFTPTEMDYLLSKGMEYGLKPKVHVNQFTSIGGIEVAVKHKAISVDHLEVMEEVDIALLQSSRTLPTLLPSCSFFLRIPYAPARRLINENMPIVLASDFNPGSTPSGNMNFVVSLACIYMRITPEEAINAATINAAHAMEIQDELGSIAIGKKASFFITEPIPSYAFLPYSFGHNIIKEVYINGKLM